LTAVDQTIGTYAPLSAGKIELPDQLFKVTQDHRKLPGSNRSGTQDFLFVIRQPISYCFKGQRRFRSKKTCI